jgi:cytosine/adenosine deaminase-related metal-dependent hydrolase
MSIDTPYFETLRSEVGRLGGLHNAHLHLDRASTLPLDGARTAAASYVSLTAKHGLIPSIHSSSFYEPAQLKERVRGYLDIMVRCGTTRADSVVDVTLDRVGLSAFRAFNELSADVAGALDLQVGAYSPLGFTDQEPARWELLEEAACDASFIGALPERDDQLLYPDHIGFDEHCRRILQLAHGLGKPVHIHADQRNDPREAASESVVRIMRELNLVGGTDEPWVWLVHVISPSTYDEKRFSRLIEDLAALNVGVICCPSAAISMRQYRPLLTPTFNSIARVLEMLAAGVHVRLGSDNLCDVTSPASTPDLTDEVFVLSNALRFYDMEIMAHLAAGVRLTPESHNRVKEHLAHDREEVDRSVRLYSRDAASATELDR